MPARRTWPAAHSRRRQHSADSSRRNGTWRHRTAVGRGEPADRRRAQALLLPVADLR